MIANLLNTVGTRSLSMLLNFLLVIASTHLLGADGRGVIGIFIATYSMIMMFIQFIGGSPIIYLSNKHSYGHLLFPSYIWSLIVGGFAYGVLCLYPALDEDYQVHICLIAILHSLWMVNSFVLMGKERVKDHNLLQLLYILFLMVGFISIYSLAFSSVYAYIYALYIANVIVLVLSVILVIPDWRSSLINVEASFSQTLKKLLSLGFWAQSANLLQFLNYRLSYFILISYVSIGNIGIYSAAIQVGEALWIIAKSFSLVLYARVSNEADEQKAQNISLILAKFSFIFTTFLCILILLIPDSLFQVIFGDDFIGISKLLLYLFPGISAFGFSILISSYFSGIGKFYINTLSSFIGLIITIIACYLLIPVYGTTGAAIATSFSYCTSALFLVICFIRFRKISILYLLPRKKELIDLIAIIRNSWLSFNTK